MDEDHPPRHRSAIDPRTARSARQGRPTPRHAVSGRPVLAPVKSGAWIAPARRPHGDHLGPGPAFPRQRPPRGRPGPVSMADLSEEEACRCNIRPGVGDADAGLLVAHGASPAGRPDEAPPHPPAAGQGPGSRPGPRRGGGPPGSRPPLQPRPSGRRGQGRRRRGGSSSATAWPAARTSRPGACATGDVAGRKAHHQGPPVGVGRGMPLAPRQAPGPHRPGLRLRKAAGGPLRTRDPDRLGEDGDARRATRAMRPALRSGYRPPDVPAAEPAAQMRPSQSASAVSKDGT